MSTNSDLEGIEEELERLEKLGVNIDRIACEELKDLGITWKNSAKLNTPVVTGDMRNSWLADLPPKKHKDLTLTLENKAEYAIHVEYGHRQDVGRYVPAIGKRLKAPYVRGQYILRRSTQKARDKLPQVLRDIKHRAEKELSE